MSVMSNIGARLGLKRGGDERTVGDTGPIPALSQEQKAKAERSIENKYNKVANGPKGHFKYPTGAEGLRLLGYDPKLIARLPEEVAASYCGVGALFSLGRVDRGEEVLDIGCGAGVDAILAAMLVGPDGSVTGLDMVSQMLDTARRNAKLADVGNLELLQGGAGKLDFQDGQFDVVISNGVFNLIVDKKTALNEALRVLKPGGRLMIADQIRTGQMPKETSVMVKSWGRWEGGSIPGKVFLAMLEEAGFVNGKLVSKTGVNSSAVTEGVLISAEKPKAGASRQGGRSMNGLLDNYQKFFDEAYKDGALDAKTKIMIALGASLGSGCEPWTQYCLAVARKMGTSEEELTEAMAVVMTVGASKIKCLQDKFMVPAATEEEPKTGEAENQPSPEEECPTWSVESGSGWA